MSGMPSDSFLSSIRHRRLTRTSKKTDRSLHNGHRPHLSFSDNDYLGLSQHPKVKHAAQQAIEEHGTGAKAARLLASNLSLHHKLEESLARWKATERALLFSAGYLVPLGVIPTLVKSEDTIVMERNAHACLFDGAKLSMARIRLFDRRNPETMIKALELTRKLNPKGKLLIVAESLHSMDGDLLPLAEIIQWKENYGAWLLLDEAHGGGVLGPDGSGLAAQLGLSSRVEIQMGTLGKSLGSSGGFVAASDEIISDLVNEGRTFLFGTALAPAQAGSALAALQIIQSEEGEKLRVKLNENILRFGSLRTPRLRGPIQPIPCSDNRIALETSRLLSEVGIDVPAIRPPTVPEGTSRLRVSLSSRHSPDDIQQLARRLNEYLPPS